MPFLNVELVDVDQGDGVYLSPLIVLESVNACSMQLKTKDHQDPPQGKSYVSYIMILQRHYYLQCCMFSP